MKQEHIDWIIKNKQALTFWLTFSIIALSVFAIAFVIYFQFFWEPKEIIDPLWVNVSNFSQ